MGVSFDLEDSRECCDSEYIPVVRSGGWSDIGFRQSMEDTFVCCDDFMHDYGLKKLGPGPNAFYGVCFYGFSLSFELSLRLFLVFLPFKS